MFDWLRKQPSAVEPDPPIETPDPPIETPDPPIETPDPVPRRANEISQEAYIAVMNGMKMCPICAGDMLQLKSSNLYSDYGHDLVYDFGCFECKRVITVQLNGTLGPR